jgi:hypothetical protein
MLPCAKLLLLRLELGLALPNFFFEISDGFLALDANRTVGANLSSLWSRL